MDPNKLPGSLKIAILIQSMSEEASQLIINSLDEKEKEVVSEHMAQMGSIPPDLVEKVVEEFAETARHAKSRKRLGIPEKGNKEKGE